MQSVIRSIFVLFSLGFFTVASAQLPPKVIADKYLIQAEQLLEKNDYIAALDMMDKIIALRNEHKLTLPDEFHFKYAQVAFSVGSVQTALDAVGKYLSAETEGEFYKEALALLLKIEEELKESEFSPENTCAGKPIGSSCWMALTNQPECYVWNPDLLRGQTMMTWSGECSGGFAEGKGTLTGNYKQAEISADTSYVESRIEATGHLQNGKKHGQWVERYFYRHWPREQEGLYVNGKRHGEWVTRYSDGDVDKVPYVKGKRHGQWVRRDSSGVVLREGPYVDGKKHGHWVEGYWYTAATIEGSYVDGKRHGEWVMRAHDGRVGGGSYVDGKAQGHWVIPSSRREQEEGSYVDGKRHGHWVIRSSDTGEVFDKGPYVNGKRHGQWVISEGGGYTDIVTYINGRPQD